MHANLWQTHFLEIVKVACNSKYSSSNLIVRAISKLTTPGVQEMRPLLHKTGTRRDKEVTKLTKTQGIDSNFGVNQSQ